MLQAAADIRRIIGEVVHHEGHRQVEHSGSVQHLPYHRPVYVDVQGVGPAQHGRLADVAPGQVGLEHSEILRHIVVEGQDAVAAAETHLIGQVVDIYGIVLVGEICLSPYAEYDAVSDDGEDEIVQDASGHHQEPLPGLLGAELPGLGLLLEALQVHRLVHHSANLAIASQRQPADAVLGLGLRRLGEKFLEPLALLGREKFHAARIEKQEELVHPYPENLCKSEVAELVDDDEQREGQDHLERFDKDYHLSINSLARILAHSSVAKMSSSEGFATKFAPSMHSCAMRGMS